MLFKRKYENTFKYSFKHPTKNQLKKINRIVFINILLPFCMLDLSIYFHGTIMENSLNLKVSQMEVTIIPCED